MFENQPLYLRAIFTIGIATALVVAMYFMEQMVAGLSGPIMFLLHILAFRGLLYLLGVGFSSWEKELQIIVISVIWSIFLFPYYLSFQTGGIVTQTSQGETELIFSEIIQPYIPAFLTEWSTWIIYIISMSLLVGLLVFTVQTKREFRSII